MDQGSRLEKLIKALNFNQKSFAQSLGMTQPNISKMINRANNLSVEVLNKITNVHKNVNVHWLLTGEGEMFGMAQTAQITMAGEPEAIYRKEKSPLLYRDVEQILEDYAREIKALQAAVARLEEVVEQLRK